MLAALFLALFLPCAGMSAVFVVYMCLLWCSASSGGGRGNDTDEFRTPVKPVSGKGLTEAELEKLPRVSGKELVLETDCAVCLEKIESEEPARLVPGCNHGFHVQCADTWLSRHSICPVCRAMLGPDIFNTSSQNSC